MWETRAPCAASCDWIVERMKRASGTRRVVKLAVVAGVLALAGCDDHNPAAPADDSPRTRFALETLGPIPYPADNGHREERIALGRLLFFDPILGGEKDVACATCHHPDFAFADRRQFGAGTSGVGLGPGRSVSISAVSGAPVSLEPRNTPTILNVAFNADESGEPSVGGLQFWDGRVRSLEVQATKPIGSRVEMRGDAYPGTEAEATAAALDSVLTRLRDIPEYRALFAQAFPEAALRGGGVIDSSTYARAIAAYERELVSRNSAYDRYVDGDDGALDEQDIEGLTLFFTKGKCSVCHSGPMFSDFEFVVQGVPQEGVGKLVIPGDDCGREEFTLDPAHRYAFRTPSLRNVALTAPYMHDGVFETLEQVLHFYNDGALPRHPGVPEDRLDPDLRAPLGLTDAEMDAIVAFLGTLTDPGTTVDPMLLAVPARVPSGLTPVFGLGAP